ncbi:MAG: hypothetical protein ACE14V_14315, partial [bacterium]
MRTRTQVRLYSIIDTTMETSELKPIIESLLFVADEPLTIRKIKQIVEDTDEPTIRKMLEARQRVAPNAKVGIGGIGRGFLLPLFDKTFPKDVPITDMESRAIWTPRGLPMQLFASMGERERTLVPR